MKHFALRKTKNKNKKINKLPFYLQTWAQRHLVLHAGSWTRAKEPELHLSFPAIHSTWCPSSVERAEREAFVLPVVRCIFPNK